MGWADVVNADLSVDVSDEKPRMRGLVLTRPGLTDARPVLSRMKPKYWLSVPGRRSRDRGRTLVVARNGRSYVSYRLDLEKDVGL